MSFRSNRGFIVACASCSKEKIVKVWQPDRVPSGYIDRILEYYSVEEKQSKGLTTINDLLRELEELRAKEVLPQFSDV